MEYRAGLIADLLACAREPWLEVVVRINIMRLFFVSASAQISFRSSGARRPNGELSIATAKIVSGDVEPNA